MHFPVLGLNWSKRDLQQSTVPRAIILSLLTVPKNKYGDWYFYPQFLAHENHKIAHKNAQKSFMNFKPRIGNIAITVMNFAPPRPQI